MAEAPDTNATVATVDEAEIAGWACLAVYCGCRITHLDWHWLRRRSRYRRLGEIIPRLRCLDCGRHIKSASLHWRGGRDATDVREKAVLEARRADPATPSV